MSGITGKNMKEKTLRYPGHVEYVRVLKEEDTNIDDTDGDDVPDFLDIDDDGDFFITKEEIKNPLTGIAYPFNDIPVCATDGNKKVHVSAVCHP